MMIDLHCHILPGLDDGAKDMEACREMLEAAWAEIGRASCRERVSRLV